MSRKRNPYIPLFTHDIMSSMKCRRLSMRATGLYLWLLCLMNEKPQQGRWALSTNEDHPTWKNSLTYRALQNADKYERLPMFATLMARKFLPWKSGEVLKALQELYRFKLIVVEDDAIIQPRMYHDNGFKLREDTMLDYMKDDPNDPLDDPDPELAAEYKNDVERGHVKRTKNGTRKGTQKVHGIHAHAPRAESESEYSNNDIEKGVQGETGTKDELRRMNYEGRITKDELQKTEYNNLKERKTARNGVSGEGVRNLSNNGRKRTTMPSKTHSGGKKKVTVADNPPTLEDVQAYFDERAAQGKPFIYITPDDFYDACCQSGWVLNNGKPMMDWRARCRTFENYRRDHGDAPVSERKARNRGKVRSGEPVPQTRGKDYSDWN